MTLYKNSRNEFKQTKKLGVRGLTYYGLVNFKNVPKLLISIENKDRNNH